MQIRLLLHHNWFLQFDRQPTDFIEVFIEAAETGNF